MSESEDETPVEKTGIDRRAAIKKGIVGTAIAGVAWSAPRVEGLSLRPDYARAATPVSGVISVTLNSTNNGGGGVFQADVDCPGGGTIHLAADLNGPSGNAVFGVVNFAGGATGTFNGANIDPSPPWNVSFGPPPGGGDVIVFPGVSPGLGPTLKVSYDCF